MPGADAEAKGEFWNTAPSIAAPTILSDHTMDTHLPGFGGPGGRHHRRLHQLTVLERLEHAVFEVVLSIQSQRPHTIGYALALIIINGIQLLQPLLVVLDGRPLAERAASRSNPFDVEALLVSGGYSSYVRTLLFFSLLMALGLGLSLWLRLRILRGGQIPYQWPLKLLVFLRQFFFDFVYVWTVGFLLVPVDCSADGGRGVEGFVDRRCLASSHIFLAMASSILCAGFIVLGYFVSAACFCAFRWESATASPDSSFGTNWLLLRTAVALAATFLNREPKLCAPLVGALAAWLVYICAFVLPFYNKRVNRAFGACAAAVAGAGLIATMRAYSKADAPWFGIALWPTMLVCAAATHALIARRDGPFVLTEFDLPTINTRVVCRRIFAHPHEVELASRIAVYDPSPESISQAGAVLLRGLHLFPESHTLLYLYSEFLERMAEDRPRAMIFAEKLRRAQPGANFRYWLQARSTRRLAGSGSSNFSQEQHVTDSDTLSVTGDMTLVMYVEFHKAYHDAAKSLRHSLRSVHKLWAVVFEQDVLMDTVGRALRSIVRHQKKTDTALRLLQSKYPHSAKALRLRAHFLDVAQQRHEEARRLRAEAAQIEHGASHNGTDMAMHARDHKRLNDRSMVDETIDAIFVIDATGIMRDVNANAIKMFGCRRDELIGVNISAIMPSPFRELHDMFLTRYVSTGISSVIGKRRLLWAQHKLGHSFPIALMVTTVDAPEGGVLFAGVIHRELQPIAKIVVVNSDGIIRFGSEAFFAVYGDPATLLGQSISRALISLITGIDCMKAFSESMHIGLTRDGVTRRQRVTVNARAAAGIEWFELSLHDMHNRAAVLDIDVTGTINQVNQAMVDLFGYSHRELVGSNIAMLMPLPYSHYHGSYVRRFVKTGRAHFLLQKDRRRTVRVKHRDGHLFKCELQIVMMGNRANNPTFRGYIKLSESTLEVTADTSDTLPTAIVTQPDGIIVATNDAFVDALNVTEHEAYGKDVNTLLQDLKLNEGEYHISGVVDDPTQLICYTCGPAEAHDGRSCVELSLLPMADMEPLVGLDAEGGIVDITTSACLLFGTSAHDAIGRPISQFAESMSTSQLHTRFAGILCEQRDVIVVKHSSGRRHIAFSEMAQNETGFQIIRIDPKLGLRGFDGNNSDRLLRLHKVGRPTAETPLTQARRLPIHSLSGSIAAAKAEAATEAPPAAGAAGGEHDSLRSTSTASRRPSTNPSDDMLRTHVENHRERFRTIEAAVSSFDLPWLVRRLASLSKAMHYTLIAIFIAAFITMWVYSQESADRATELRHFAELQAATVLTSSNAASLLRTLDCSGAGAELVASAAALSASLSSVYSAAGDNQVRAAIHQSWWAWELVVPETLVYENTEMSLWELGLQYARLGDELVSAVCVSDPYDGPAFFLTNNSALVRESMGVVAAAAYDLALDAHEEALGSTAAAHLIAAGVCALCLVFAILPLLLTLSRRRVDLFRLFVSLPRVARMEMLTLSAAREGRINMSANAAEPTDLGDGASSSDDEQAEQSWDEASVEDSSVQWVGDEIDFTAAIAGGGRSRSNSLASRRRLESDNSGITDESEDDDIASGHLSLSKPTADVGDGMIGRRSSLQAAGSGALPPRRSSVTPAKSKLELPMPVPIPVRSKTTSDLSSLMKPAEEPLSEPTRPVLVAADRRASLTSDLRVLHTEVSQTLQLIFRPMIPALLCLVFVAVSYAIHTSMASEAEGAHRTFIASQMIPQALVVRETAARLVLDSPDAVLQMELREELNAGWELLEAQRSALIFGDLGMDVSSALADMASDERRLLFSSACLREAEHTCLNATTTLGEYSGHGLDALLQHYIQSARFVATACDGCVDADNAAFLVLWELGDTDVVDGLFAWIDVLTAAIDEERRNEGGYSGLLTAIYVVMASIVYRNMMTTVVDSLGREWRLITALLASVPARYGVVDRVKRILPSTHHRALTPGENNERRASLSKYLVGRTTPMTTRRPLPNQPMQSPGRLTARTARTASFSRKVAIAGPSESSEGPM